jgi:hypothetical protein
MRTPAIVAPRAAIVAALGIGSNGDQRSRGSQGSDKGNAHSNSPSRQHNAGVIMDWLCHTCDEPVLN